MLFRRQRIGQSTVEYFLVLSVLVIAIWAAAQLFAPDYQRGLEGMQDYITGVVERGVVSE